MSVVAFPGAITDSDRKAFFLSEFAASFDKYVSDYGEEPDAFVAVMGGVRQNCRVFWSTQGETEGAPLAFIALSGAVVQKELVNPDH